MSRAGQEPPGRGSSRESWRWLTREAASPSGVALDLLLAGCRRLQTVQNIDQLPQTTIVTAIETESDTWALDVVIIGKFLGRWINPLDLLPNNDVGKIFIHGLDGGIGRRVV